MYAGKRRGTTARAVVVACARPGRSASGGLGAACARGQVMPSRCACGPAAWACAQARCVRAGQAAGARHGEEGEARAWAGGSVERLGAGARVGKEGWRGEKKEKKKRRKEEKWEKKKKRRGEREGKEERWREIRAENTALGRPRAAPGTRERDARVKEE